MTSSVLWPGDSPKNTVRYRYTGSGMQYAVSKTGKRAFYLGQTRWHRMNANETIAMLCDLSGWYDHDDRNPWVKRMLAAIAAAKKHTSDVSASPGQVTGRVSG